MSWLEDNGLDYDIDDLVNIQEIRDSLTDEKIDNLYNHLEEQYIILVCSILRLHKEGKRLSDKQKECLARYIYDYNLENMI